MSKLHPTLKLRTTGKAQSHSSKPKTEVKYRTYYFSIEVMKFVADLPNEKIYWVTTDQLLRAATSIGANIIEGRAASLLTLKNKKKL